MDRYLFRGKRVDNGEWVRGNVINNYDGKVFIGEIVFEVKNNELDLNGYGVCEVIPETIGQCVNLKDKKGKLIFDGDINEDDFIVTCIDGSEQDDFGMDLGWYLQRDDFESWTQMSVGEDYNIIGTIHDKETI